MLASHCAMKCQVACSSNSASRTQPRIVVASSKTAGGSVRVSYSSGKGEGTWARKASILAAGLMVALNKHDEIRWGNG